jgi:hypothetical protein
MSRLYLLAFAGCTVVLAGCQRQPDPDQVAVREATQQAFEGVGLNSTAASLLAGASSRRIASTIQAVRLMTRHASAGEIVDVALDGDRTEKIVGYSEIPARNCAGSNLIKLTETISRSVSRDFTIGGKADVTAGVAQLAQAAVGTHFSIRLGEEVTRSFQFQVEALPHTNTVYSIVWKEVWRSGHVTIRTTAGETVRVPFNLKEALEYEQDSADDVGC